VAGTAIPAGNGREERLVCAVRVLRERRHDSRTRPAVRDASPKAATAWCRRSRVYEGRTKTRIGTRCSKCCGEPVADVTDESERLAEGQSCGAARLGLVGAYAGAGAGSRAALAPRKPPLVVL